jgi:hypothetical protein
VRFAVKIHVTGRPERPPSRQLSALLGLPLSTSSLQSLHFVLYRLGRLHHAELCANFFAFRSARRCTPAVTRRAFARARARARARCRVSIESLHEVCQRRTPAVLRRAFVRTRNDDEGDARESTDGGDTRAYAGQRRRLRTSWMQEVLTSPSYQASPTTRGKLNRNVFQRLA